MVVSGAGTFDKMFEDIARRELQVNDRGLEFSYLSGLPLGRLLEEVAHLPRDTIILFLTFSRDGTGEIFNRLTWPRRWPPFRQLRCIRCLASIPDAA